MLSSRSVIARGVTRRRAALCLTLFVTGCVRIGFGDVDARSVGDSNPPVDMGDAAFDGLAPDLAPALDLVVADIRVAGINEPCSPPPCAAGLVCSGAFADRYCRPACGVGSVCPSGESCGRPVGAGGKVDPSVPRACLGVSQANRYELCDKAACKLGLACIRGDFAVCLTKCLNQNNCAPTETCAGPSGSRICLPNCGVNDACPPNMTCVGNSPKGCAPVISKKLGETCDQRHLCAAGLRCVGTSATTLRYCHVDCDPKKTPTTCAAGTDCIVDDGGTSGACLTSCGLFDTSPKCAPYEFCFPNPKAMKIHCFPGKGATTDCSAAPCVSGLICVNKKCAKACDNAHPCPGTKNCNTLNFGGQSVPWKACQ